MKLSKIDGVFLCLVFVFGMLCYALLEAGRNLSGMEVTTALIIGGKEVPLHILEPINQLSFMLGLTLFSQIV